MKSSTVRQLTKNDIGEFFPIRLEALKLVPTAFGSSFEEETAKGPAWFESVLESQKDSNAIFGAFYEGVLVGTIGIFSDLRLKSGHKAMIWGMYVRSEHRGQGLGKQLVQQAIEHAKLKMKAEAVYLSVESSNDDAKNIYLKCGFKVWGREPKSLYVNGRFHDEDYMFLNLVERSFKTNPSGGIKYFVSILSKVEGRSPSTEVVQQHIEYLRRLNSTGQLVLCGPCSDHPTGMVVLKAADKNEATKIAEEDPFVKEGLKTVEVRTWLIANEENNYLG